MRINIKGNDITPDKIADALESCEHEYGLRIKGATIYLRLERDGAEGRTVEPLDPESGQEICRTFQFWKPKEKTAQKPAERPAPQDLITAKEMFALCETRARRILSGVEMRELIELEKLNQVDRQTFQQCLEQTMVNNGRFSMAYLGKLIRHRCK